MTDDTTNDSANELDIMCELCGELVKEGEPHIRVGVDAANSRAELAEAISHVVVFAMFHSRCVMDTYHAEEFDDVPYIMEAREFLDSSDLCDDCILELAGDHTIEESVNKQLKSRPNHLKIVKDTDKP